jgi:hypothetical protein
MHMQVNDSPVNIKIQNDAIPPPVTQQPLPVHTFDLEKLDPVLQRQLRPLLANLSINDA